MNTFNSNGDDRTGSGTQCRDSERSEPSRNEVPDPVLNTEYAGPEVPAKAKRRRFSAAYKLRVLGEADACTKPGEISALLRREGLYSSRLTYWRKQRDIGALEALNNNRGRKKTIVNPLQKQVDELEKNNSRLKKQLKQAHLIIDFQKKAAEIMEIHLDDSEKNK